MENPKIFWWCWLQGLENAPSIAKNLLEVIAPKLFRLPNQYRHAQKYFKLHPFPRIHCQKIQQVPDYSNSFFKSIEVRVIDKLRWNLDRFMCFVYGTRRKIFTRAFVYIPSDIDSNCLIVSAKGHQILITTRDLLYKYWQDHNSIEGRGFYFVFQHLFRLAAEKYPEEWARVPIFSNILPQILGTECSERIIQIASSKLRKCHIFINLRGNILLNNYLQNERLALIMNTS